MIMFPVPPTEVKWPWRGGQFEREHEQRSAASHVVATSAETLAATADPITADVSRNGAARNGHRTDSNR